ncbi:LysR family transcriptional regulator [Amycolatopsis sp. cmx-4-68]|uniref:LysR family transcriptional regulator n=1 Tax=Amycolatopsis sp. cmx-4-68 TaxID=2790938 RepID=UPI00397A3BBA
MNLRQLECFLAVADELHFARAADRLHLSPASVSEAIAALERRVGGPLFDRSSRRVSLTAHGLRFGEDGLEERVPEIRPGRARTPEETDIRSSRRMPRTSMYSASDVRVRSSNSRSPPRGP